MQDVERGPHNMPKTKCLSILPSSHHLVASASQVQVPVSYVGMQPVNSHYPIVSNHVQQAVKQQEAGCGCSPHRLGATL